MDANLLLRYRKYLMSIEMIYLCLMVIISAIQAIVIDVPATADSLRGKTVYTLFTDKRTWKEAREVCRNHGGYLINIETEEKYQRYLSLKTSGTPNFRTYIGTPWIGLYWTSSTSRHWDGPGCPPPETHMSASDHWRNGNDFSYTSGKRCYREIGNEFDSQDCDNEKTFICEHYTNDTCGYEESTMTTFTVSGLGNESTILNECKSSCDNTPGCFLTSNLRNVCLMLLATDVSNSTIAIKKCSYETAKVTGSQNVPSDDTDPTDCATTTSSLVSSMITYPAVTGIITETSTTTLLITITSAGTSNCIVTDSSRIEALTTPELTTENITTGVPTASVVSNIIPETTTSSIMITPTETIAAGVPHVTQIVGNIITTVVQISTVTIGGPSLVVSTVTETQTQSCETVTVDVAGSSSSTDMYSPGMAPAIDTTIQSSFDSLQVNETISSSPNGIKGTIGSDGIMRTLMCRDVIVVTPDPVAEQAAVKSIVNKLTVDKKNISAVVQKKVSAQDKRSSSVAIGYMGIGFLIIPFLLIFAVDLPTCLQGGRDVIKLCKDEDIF
ncbi:uncharacterized protein LOC126816206 [Patella vulgata]|uniref:uncharacterized protein LOC126816206 n=1 Tax=Patella vulgata TaxID=6465 RepID=UPI0024A9692B|nr:uncharacterized protein LOC126816206 [Patella vulgata]